MNKINHLTQKLLVGAITLALAGFVAQASADTVPQNITVVKLHGAARYQTDGTTWHVLKRGDVLQPGVTIQTADDSWVDIKMGDEKDSGATVEPIGAAPSPTSASGGGTGGGGSDMGPKSNVVHIYPNSSLAIDKLTLEKTGADEVSETQLDLRAGRIMGNVKKLSAASRYEVKIPNGVAGIRGTTYVIDASGTIYVLFGQVILSYIQNGNPVTVTINAGQQFNPFTSPAGSVPTQTPPAEEQIFISQVTNLGTTPPPPTPPQTLNGVVIKLGVGSND